MREKIMITSNFDSPKSSFVTAVAN